MSKGEHTMEPTARMLDAGVQAFNDWETSDEPSARRMVESVYRSMVGARPLSPPVAPDGTPDSPGVPSDYRS